MKDEFIKELCLTVASRQILPTTNVAGNPKSQISIDNFSESI